MFSRSTDECCGRDIGINEIGFASLSGAIPGNLARAVAQELIEHGRVARSWLGLELQPAGASGKSALLHVRRGSQQLLSDAGNAATHGIGLANLRVRLEQLYGERGMLVAQAVTDGFCTTVALPLCIRDLADEASTSAPSRGPS
ncbi:MAG: hypothetical protein AB8H80_01325 [Planctomycetota bacterium]